MSGDYRVPKTKTALVQWLGRYWPASVPAFKRKRKEVLYAIYFSVIARIRRGKSPGASNGQ